MFRRHADDEPPPRQGRGKSRASTRGRSRASGRSGSAIRGGLRGDDGSDGSAAGSGGGDGFGSGGAQEQFIVEALDDLRDTVVQEIMTPRVDVVALPIPVTADDVARAVRETGHSCFPVYDDNLDDLIGVLFVNDLFRSGWSVRSGRFERRAVVREGTEARNRIAADPGSGSGSGSEATPENDARGGAISPVDTMIPDPPDPVDISRRLRQPFLVPESRLVLDVLAEMRRQRRAFAVVVDEHGGVEGVLTVKDLLGALVGDLPDEFEPADEPDLVRVDGNRWLVAGRMNADDVREQLGIAIAEGEYVTLGGYLFDAFGHIPAEGESIVVDGWELQVTEMDKRRIAKVVARRDAVGEVPSRATAHSGSRPGGSPSRSEPTTGNDRTTVG